MGPLLISVVLVFIILLRKEQPWITKGTHSLTHSHIIFLLFVLLGRSVVLVYLVHLAFWGTYTHLLKRIFSRVTHLSVTRACESDE